jgi:hypothetical protein
MGAFKIGLVEPIPEALEILKARLSGIFPPGRTEVFECVVGNEQGTVLLNIASNGGESSSILEPLKLHEFASNITFDSKITVEQFRL